MSSLFSSRVANEDDDKYDLDNLSPHQSQYSSAFRTQTLHSPPGTTHSYTSNSYARPHARQHNILTEHDLELPESDESDAEVPPSLMIEMPQDVDEEVTDQRPLLSERQWEKSPIRESAPRPPSSNLHNLRQRIPTPLHSTRSNMTPHDRTMWRWANIANMDHFFQRVYSYYLGKGYYCILLAKVLNLLTLAFTIIFSTFLVGCVNYSEIPSHTKLSEVLEPQCLSKLSFPKVLFLLIFVVWWVWQALQFWWDLPALNEMHMFYVHLLDVSDKDMATITWQEILERIISVRESNPNMASTAPIKLDAHDIANRIMRKDNYLIALFNKDILNITIPLPYLRNMHVFTRDLEWNLSFCVLSYVFDSNGQIRKRFLKDKNRAVLAEGLRRRFIIMGFLNLICAPFILAYLIIYFFFRYFEEYHKNPGAIGSRNYSPFAKWKLREFNELPHLFKRRLNSSHVSANKYLDQFPKDKTALIARFVAFISGSFAGILAIITLFDSEALLNFELTPNGTILFYIGLFGGLFAVSRGLIPDDTLVFEPEQDIRKVIEVTHYFPNEWRGKLHTDEVKGQFSQMFDMKITLFLQEFLSILFTPLVLWYSLPQCSTQIIDFFREFTVHVDGLGYVCSFALFDFRRHGNVKYGAPVAVQDEHYVSNNGKMEKSFLNFKANNPSWMPTDPAGSMYLSRMAEYKDHRAHSKIDEEMDDDNESQLSHSSIVNSRYSYASPNYDQWRTNKRTSPSVPSFIPNSSAAMAPDLSEPNSPFERRSTHRQPAADSFEHDIPSELGDFAPARMIHPDEYQDQNDEDDGRIDPDHDNNVLGLLNQIYDHRPQMK
ncbi:hypothetical protein INT44_000799 [Umbelopsis vinacea]|uniref:Autophagy-related protein 9 n=1 Tax=Umbelopsis vinacea TaxID=44442 RepID=A0A8H7UQ77_9FUNG|nr:hypothetical protein INT44_000799 [Umbelopsis vinacea]